MTEAIEAPAQAVEATPAAPEVTQAPPPSKTAELAKQFEGLSPEESREALAELLKRHPLKTKLKGEEVSINDLKKIEETVREGTGYGKMRRELAAEKAELSKTANVIRAAMDGDQNALREILFKNPGTFESAKQLIAAALRENVETEQIPEEYRDQILEGRNAKSELERYRQLEQQRAEEERQVAERAAAAQGASLLQSQIIAEAKVMGISKDDLMSIGEQLVQNLRDNQALGSLKTPGEVLRETVEELHARVESVNSRMFDEKLSAKERVGIVGRKFAEAAAMSLLEAEPEFEKKIALKYINRLQAQRTTAPRSNGAPMRPATTDTRELFRKLSTGGGI